ncbi:hypothetical protein TPHA_0I01690 [Tetrapisispora phaffii CBS 4417]|uniref:Anaphase-promoting complex subunit 4-like WD40 domain-containing protein n=1 Tax=Tetrapisispora phaffii (strain ATCC 24235 / CBS 4417 / NBRC 1672 / NRRL Y-8282 / UCD 70-5) TaxID=1071381 RepID=G8BXP5_TETPH|nr:hypothetical protein TPHA_0I01690 [Tetrapisispora phaffii CBS 4417]CCE64673.1 hypothetical protein TPHA_0I01690 [Tetrapisispora phaffii CBS 4417]
MLRLLRNIALASPGSGGQVTSVKFSPNGELVAVCKSTVIELFELASIEQHDEVVPVPFKTVLTSHIKPISEICWSPDGQCIASGSDDFTVEITHLQFGQIYRLVSHTAPVVSLCFNVKGNLLCSSSMDESIKIWDTLNGVLLRTISAHSGAVVSIDMPQLDSSIISSGSFDGLIRIFDTASGHCLKTLTYDKDWKIDTGVVAIANVRWSKNGKFLLVKSLDGIVKIWDCIRGYVVRTFKIDQSDDQEANGASHSTDAYRMRYAFGMDFLYPENDHSPIVISGYENGDIYLWDSSNKKLLQLIKANEFKYSSSPIIDINTHQNYVCTVTMDGECLFWKWES